MQNCYIRVVKGEPFEHPLVEENLRQIIKNFDANNIPDGVEKFIRHPYPEIKFLETFVGTTYKRIDGVIQDVHEVRALTEDEKHAKIKFMKDFFPFKSWSLNEETGEWIPPVPYPNDGKLYNWDEEKLLWFENVVETQNLFETVKEIQQEMEIPVSVLETVKQSIE